MAAMDESKNIELLLTGNRPPQGNRPPTRIKEGEKKELSMSPHGMQIHIRLCKLNHQCQEQKNKKERNYNNCK